MAAIDANTLYAWLFDEPAGPMGLTSPFNEWNRRLNLNSSISGTNAICVGGSAGVQGTCCTIGAWPDAYGMQGYAELYGDITSSGQDATVASMFAGDWTIEFGLKSQNTWAASGGLPQPVNFMWLGASNSGAVVWEGLNLSFQLGLDGQSLSILRLEYTASTGATTHVQWSYAPSGAYTWDLLALTHTGSTFELFVNGVSAGAVTGLAPMTLIPTHDSMGFAVTVNTRVSIHALDQMRWSNKVRTAPEQTEWWAFNGTTTGGTPHRYWRFWFTAPSANISLAEIELRPTVGGTDATVPGGPATADSVLAGYPAIAAVDNNTTDNVGNYWMTAAGVVGPHWWQYDFGLAPKYIAQFAITARNSTYAASQTPTAFLFQYSDDGSTWTTIQAVSGLTWSQAQQQVFRIGSLSAMILEVPTYGRGPAQGNGYARAQVNTTYAAITSVVSTGQQVDVTFTQPVALNPIIPTAPVGTLTHPSPNVLRLGIVYPAAPAISSIATVDAQTFDLTFNNPVTVGTPVLHGPVASVAQQASGTVRIGITQPSISSIANVTPDTFDITWDRNITVGAPALHAPVYSVVQQTATSMRVQITKPSITSIANVTPDTFDLTWDRDITVGTPTLAAPINSVIQENTSVMRVQITKPSISSITTIDSNTFDILWDRDVTVGAPTVENPVSDAIQQASNKVRIDINLPPPPTIQTAISHPDNTVDVTFDEAITVGVPAVTFPLSSIAQQSDKTMRLSIMGSVRPQIDAVTATSPTTVTVSFTLDVIATDLTTLLESYTIVGDTPITVLSASFDGGRTITLTTTGHKLGGSYTLNVADGVVIASSGMVNMGGSKTYTGLGSSPHMISGIAQDRNHVLVTFDRDMDLASIANPANYSIVPGLGVLSVTAPTSRTAILTTDTMTAGVIYTVTASVLDAAQNPS